MGYLIHARNTPDGLRFREWSTTVDKYTTAPMTREEMHAYLRREADAEALRAARRVKSAIDDRLDRTAKNGTSDQRFHNGDGQELALPWETETCDECGSFHHAFTPRAHDGLCSACGEDESGEDHLPPCEARSVAGGAR